MFNTTLNDDCVFKIFSYLSPVDLLETEKVCKLWHKWTDISWRHVKKIDYNVIRQCKLKSNVSIKDILDRCGIYVQEFECYNALDSDIYYNVIAKYCPHLKKLVLYDNAYKTTEIDELEFPKKFRQLQTLELHDHADVEDGSLIEIFMNNPELESLYLSINSIRGYCLQFLPKTMKHLYLKSLYDLESVNLPSCLHKCSSLNALRIDGFMNWKDNFSEIVKASPQLMQLSLIDIPASIEPITEYKHLSRLFLHDNENLTDNVLKLICESCVNLEAVGLGNRCHVNVQRISEDGLKHLSTLSKLKELYFWFSNSVNRASLADVFQRGSLQVLRVQNCDSFDDNAVLDVLQYCKDLVCLDIFDCNITLWTVKHAYLELRKQPLRRIILDLKIYNKLINMRNVQRYRHPLLRVTKSYELKMEYFKEPVKF